MHVSYTMFPYRGVPLECTTQAEDMKHLGPHCSPYTLQSKQYLLHPLSQDHHRFYVCSHAREPFIAKSIELVANCWFWWW